MKKNNHNSELPTLKMFYVGMLLAGACCTVLLSPKWTFAPVAWMMPAFFLFYFRHATMRFKILWFVIAAMIAYMISMADVAPFPVFILAIASVISSVKWLLIYLIDRRVATKAKGFWVTLIFPSLAVAIEFIDVVLLGNGAWSSIANTQYVFSWLVQFSSIFGILGISFLIYWFASVTVWCLEKYFSKERFTNGVLIFATIFSAVLLFGAYRFYANDVSEKKSVRIAGITVPNIGIIEAVHKDVTSKIISIDPKISPSSPQLQEANISFVSFIENPDTAKFKNCYQAMYTLQDSLFALSQKAVDRGAKIIVWSEANAMMPSFMQDNFIARGKIFTQKNNVFLLMAMAVIESGKITATKNFIENKTILFAPGGKIVNVFHKNHPVPFAEHSKPGDGIVPVIKTEYGNISPSICYDADFPSTMKQLSQNQTGLLLLPSGDWHAIDPYHSYMAMFRGVENGCTVVRQVSGGLSLVTDYRGKVITSFDYFKPVEKFWIADIKVTHQTTIYSKIGDLLPELCLLISIITIFVLLLKC